MSVTVRPYRRGGFEVDIQWRSQDGRRHRERKRLDITSKTAAQRWGEGRERELLVRGPTLRRNWKEVPTLEQFAPRFMDGHARANQAKPSGIAHKELVFKNRLFPILGAKRLDDITDEDVQQLKFTLRHRKPTTVNNVLSVLSMLLKKAVEWRVLDHPRCMVRLVKRQQGTARFYSFEEFEALVEASRRVSPVAQLVVLIGGEPKHDVAEGRRVAYRCCATVDACRAKVASRKRAAGPRLQVRFERLRCIDRCELDDHLEAPGAAAGCVERIASIARSQPSADVAGQAGVPAVSLGLAAQDVNGRRGTHARRLATAMPARLVDFRGERRSAGRG